jgi:hypothetical protein
VHPFPGPLCASELDPAETIDRVVANFERPRTATIQGVPAPLHLPAEDIEETRLDLAPAHAAEADTIVVDVEVNAAGQIVISGAERV